MARLLQGRRANLSSGAWLAVALGALFGVQFVLHPYLAYPAAAVTLWLLRRRVGPFVRILVMLVAALAGYRGHRAMLGFLTERDAVRQSLGSAARCAGEGRVEMSPVLRDGRFVVVVDATRLDCEGPIAGVHRLRLVGAPDGLGRGDTIAFVAQLGPVAPLQQLELTNPIPRATSLGVVASGGALTVERIATGSGWRHAIDRARAWVRRRILATYAPKAEALGRALVLGENDLDPDEQLAFQRSGLSHLLAVSGTHLVFAVVSVVAALRALLLRFPSVAARHDVPRWLGPLGALLALLYADFAGGSGSAWRAAWMLATVYAATALGRRLGGLRALAFSLIIGVLYDPLAGYDVSFLLSALATAGLVVIGPSIKRPLGWIRWQPLRWLADALATTLAAMIPCTPLLLLLSPDITVAGLLANVVAGPLGELAALPLCLAHTLMAPLPSVEHGLALAGSGALLAVASIARLSASLSWARVVLPPPTLEQFAVIGLGVLAAATFADQRRTLPAMREPSRRAQVLVVGLLTTVCLLILEGLARHAGAPEGRLRVTAVDVGQGDSLVVDLPDGRMMLIDGGGAITGGPDPGQRIILPLLRARRRRHVDIAVLTHPHPDHFGGLLTVLRELPVREFWEAGDPHEHDDSELGRLRRDLIGRGTRIRHLPELCEAFAARPGAVIQLLGPCPNAIEERHANDRSLVVRLELGQHSALLPGDAETLEESDLMAVHGQRLHADLLKLGHHGSRTSTGRAWLDRVRPSVAVVSVGLRNRFGHPHPTTLSRLAEAHVPVYRTDELGSVEWSTNGSTVTLRTAATYVAGRQ
jgi:competence protein ComEC